MKFKETKTRKLYLSSNYNFYFNKQTGLTKTWGKTKDEDPIFAPHPQILDIEISEICHGIEKNNNENNNIKSQSIPCDFCYKQNTPNGKNMSLETFKKLLSKFDTKMTLQIAFGIGSIDGNPDLFSIMQHCRDMGIIPNITINGSRMTKEYYDRLAELVGGISVSYYGNDDTCFNAVQQLLSRGVQTNIHCLVSQETYGWMTHVVKSFLMDGRLGGLNAIVFLKLKPKGRAVKGYTKIDDRLYEYFIASCIKAGINIGSDTCGAYNFINVLDKLNKKDIIQNVESCCSTRFSAYVSVDSNFYPCSFLENEEGWKEKMNVLDYDSFYDIWNHPKTINFRNKMIKSCGQYGCIKCPKFEV
jgi:MoaA/NifB/PqqE/SkfB family radical SAM enzyme